MVEFIKVLFKHFFTTATLCILPFLIYGAYKIKDTNLMFAYSIAFVWCFNCLMKDLKIIE